MNFDLREIQRILSTTRRAVEQYGMIEAGDRIAVGVSAGKDSLTLLCALAELRRFLAIPFELYAVTIDMGFKEGFDLSGVEALCAQLGVELDQIRKVCLAGAFGNYLDPASACRIGMIPPVLLDRIQPIGNAAGEGAKLSALSRKEFEYAQSLARGTEFLELASLPEFQDCYVDALEFEEDV